MELSKSNNTRPLSVNELWQQISDGSDALSQLRKKIQSNEQDARWPEMAEAQVVMKTTSDTMIYTMRDIRYLIENVVDDSLSGHAQKKKYIAGIIKEFDKQQILSKLIAVVPPFQSVTIDPLVGMSLDPGMEMGKLFSLLFKCCQDYGDENSLSNQLKSALRAIELANLQPLSTNQLWRQISNDVRKISNLRKKIEVNIGNDDTPETAEAYVVMKTTSDDMINTIIDMRYLIENIMQNASLPEDTKKKSISCILQEFDSQCLLQKLTRVVSPFDAIQVDQFGGIAMDPCIEIGKLFGLLSKCNQEYSGENNILLKMVKPEQLEGAAKDYLSNKFETWLMQPEQVVEYCKYWSYCDPGQEFKYMVALHNYGDNLIKSNNYRSVIPLLHTIITYDYNDNPDKKKIVADAYISLGQIHDPTLYYKDTYGSYNPALYKDNKEHVKPDDKKALEYYNQAVKLGSIDVLSDMVRHYYLSREYDKARELASEFFRLYEAIKTAEDLPLSKLTNRKIMLDMLYNESMKVNFIVGLMHLNDVQCPHSFNEALHYIINRTNGECDFNAFHRYVNKNGMKRISDYILKTKKDYEKMMKNLKLSSSGQKIFTEEEEQKHRSYLKLLYMYGCLSLEQEDADHTEGLSMLYYAADRGYVSAMTKIVNDATMKENIDEERAYKYIYRLLDHYYDPSSEENNYAVCINMALRLDEYCEKGGLRAHALKMLMHAKRGSIESYLNMFPNWHCSLDGKEEPGVLQWLESGTIQGSKNTVITELSRLADEDNIGAQLFWGHFYCSSFHNQYCLQKGLSYLEKVYPKIDDAELKNKWSKYIGKAYGLLVLEAIKAKTNTLYVMDKIEKGLMYDPENSYCKTARFIMLLKNAKSDNNAYESLKEIVKNYDYNKLSKDENYGNACLELALYECNNKGDGVGHYFEQAILAGNYAAMENYLRINSKSLSIAFKPIIEFIKLHENDDQYREIIGNAYYLLAINNIAKNKINYLSKAISYGDENARSLLEELSPTHKSVLYYKIPSSAIIDKISFLIGFSLGIIPSITEQEWQSGDYGAAVFEIYECLNSARTLGLNRHFYSKHLQVQEAINNLSNQINGKIHYLRTCETFNALKKLINGLVI